VENPSFFQGFAARPEVVSCALLAVADVAGSRYFDAAFRVSDVLDPVMTAGGDRLRCESFRPATASTRGWTCWAAAWTAARSATKTALEAKRLASRMGLCP
jgi:hypothetical protein